MDYDNVDAKLSFHAKILNGQDTRPFHSSKQPGVRRNIRHDDLLISINRRSDAKMTKTLHSIMSQMN